MAGSESIKMKLEFVEGELYLVKTDWVILVDEDSLDSWMARTRMAEYGTVLLFLGEGLDETESPILRFLFESKIYQYQRMYYAASDFKHVNFLTKYDPITERFVTHTKSELKKLKRDAVQSPKMS